MARYATPDDWTNGDTWGSPDPAPSQFDLDRASDVVAEMITGVIVDFKDPDSVQALARATCAQAAYFADTGDTSGAYAVAGPTSIGSLSLPGGTEIATGGPGGGRYAPEAIQILRASGMGHRTVYAW